MDNAHRSAGRLIMQQSDAVLEVLYVVERQELTIQIRVGAGRNNTLVVEGVEGMLARGSASEQGQLQLIGPAAAAFWEVLTSKRPAESGSDPITDSESERALER